MSGAAQLIPLNDEDRRILIKKRQSAVTLTAIPAILALLALAVLLVFHTLIFVMVILVFGIALAIISLTAFLAFRSASKDLQFGQKQVISGPVEAQNVDVSRTTNSDGEESNATYRFWVQIGGKKITVTEDQYYQFKKGDLVEAFIAPNSETVLGINKEFNRRPFG